MELEGTELILKSIDSTTSFFTFKIYKKVSNTYSNLLNNSVIHFLNNRALGEHLSVNFNKNVKFEFIKNEIILLGEKMAENYTIEIDVLKNTDSLIFIESYHYLENIELIAKVTIMALKL